MQEESLDARKLLSILQKVLKMVMYIFEHKSLLCTNMRLNLLFYSLALKVVNLFLKKYRKCKNMIHFSV